jgi:hypothetical protein
VITILKVNTGSFIFVKSRLETEMPDPRATPAPQKGGHMPFLRHRLVQSSAGSIESCKQNVEHSRDAAIFLPPDSNMFDEDECAKSIHAMVL